MRTSRAVTRGDPNGELILPDSGAVATSACLLVETRVGPEEDGQRPDDQHERNHDQTEHDYIVEHPDDQHQSMSAV
jgi:hypothetical protein